MGIKNILVVDDSKTELMYMDNLLTKHGFLVRIAQNPEEAFACLAEKRPDLILMDVVMPEKNGFELTRQIARNPAYADIPIVMCTSKNEPADKVWALRQGAKDYITKPVQTDELMLKIRSFSQSDQLIVDSEL